MRRLAFLFVSIAASLLSTRMVLAEHAPAPVGITVSCDCADTTGKAYGAAVKDLLARDAHYKQMSLEEAYGTGAIQIHILSTPLDSADGTTRVALSVVYLREGVMMHQFIQTCTHYPVDVCAASLIRALKDLEPTQTAMLR